MLHHLDLRGSSRKQSSNTAREVYFEEDQIILVNPNAPGEGVVWRLGRRQETCYGIPIACSKELNKDPTM